jgi:hypothetical protein
MVSSANPTVFSAPDNELVSIGKLHVSTGSIVACDPFACSSAVAFSRRIPPGEYEVRLHRVDLGAAGPRIASARLIIQPDAPIATLEAAAIEGNGPLDYFVDAGLGSFMDEAARAELARVIDEFYRAHPDGNYYTDILAAEFKRSALSPDDPGDIGDWTMHKFPGTAHNVAMFASGMGDGAYKSYWGLDSNGEIVALLTDFAIR